jgi:hypothetical protein
LVRKVISLSIKTCLTWDLFFCSQFHSHQLFHLLVILAAFVHYHGICEMAMHRLAHASECEDHDFYEVLQ